MYFVNHDLVNMVTPVKVDVLKDLLVESKYDPVETAFLVDGFTNGFNIGFNEDILKGI